MFDSRCAHPISGQNVSHRVSHSVFGTLSRQQKTRTLRQHLTRAALFPLGFLLAGLFVMAHANQEQVAELAVTPAPPSPAEVLVERFDCWTGDAPEGVEPKHSVVTLPGKQPRHVSASVGFGIWLGGDPGVVHAFCR